MSDASASSELTKGLDREPRFSADSSLTESHLPTAFLRLIDELDREPRASDFAQDAPAIDRASTAFAQYMASFSGGTGAQANDNDPAALQSGHRWLARPMDREPSRVNQEGSWRTQSL